VDDWGYAALVGGRDVAPDEEADVRRALLDCPVHAITELPDAGLSSDVSAETSGATA
jgi:ferredoxin